MNPGKLRQPVYLQEPTVTRDAYNDEVIAWADPGTMVWAEVLDLRGQTLEAARAVHATATTRIAIRYRTDIKETWRLSWGSRVYQIDGIVDRMGRQRELELTCTEIRT